MDFQITCLYVVIALDIIGVVDEVVFRYVLSCTLWENYCLQFLSYLNEVEDERPIIILLTHVRLKEGQGSYPPSVSNSLKVSKLMINELVLEIQEFRERLSDLGIKVRSVLMPIGQGRSSQLSSKDVFLSKEIVCVTVAMITTIVMDNHSWCYPACSQCHKKTNIETVPFTCPCGKDNDQPVLRYRVEVMVNHKGEQTKFLLWDRECAELIGQLVDEVNRLKIADGDVDLNASPQALDRVLGCFLAFKVKVQSRFRNVVVLKYSDELDLINVVLDMLPDTEVRLSSDELDDEPKNFEISPAQVSSNKLPRHYQNENCQSSANEPTINSEGYSDLGDQAMQCRHCNAKMWYNERISKDKNTTSPKFSLCCGDDKVELPLLQNPPKHLERLLFDDNATDSKNYQYNIRTYNMMFAFTSTGIKLDKSINETKGPLTIRIQGQPCHRIGSLLPMPGKQPKFAQLYIFDTQNEVENRINTMSQHVAIQPHIVSTLSQMLDDHNVHAKNFRMARDRLTNSQVDNVKLRLIVSREKDGRTYNLPNVSEVAALIVGDFDANSRRDIIVETQNGELQRIHELHSSYLGLQYPLLYPYGEDGYRPDILHRSTFDNKKGREIV
ncbi:hypothetical protein GmHk_09G025145 [Glycine max]|nr:hypothetical protein GmHk_09G025145 [Glycine max]